MKALLLALPLLTGCIAARPHFIGLPTETPTEILRVELKWFMLERCSASLSPELPDVDLYRPLLYFIQP